MSTPDFAIDARLEADSAFVIDLALCQVRLMKDARFPWLLVIPRRPALVELTDMPRDEQITVLDEINRAANVLKECSWPGGVPEKLNIAALGNQVRQLHVHVIGRHSDDEAWPGPIWGVGEPQPYEDSVLAELCQQLARGLSSQLGD